jgi:hypothetical protein
MKNLAESPQHRVLKKMIKAYGLLESFQVHQQPNRIAAPVAIN